MVALAGFGMFGGEHQQYWGGMYREGDLHLQCEWVGLTPIRSTITWVPHEKGSKGK